ncbi:glycosyltransferase [Vibrio breoganii]|uniref:Glycosyltransferase n=1 Tax=Vibrio breoganii TaxID=553239 RepID=A0AAN1CQY1_9VIBR|nr:MJ1255/VC2487 family glycosyltransferase [Vibrio breoganii]ANO31998.1 glycosyltransferase [Vibrio breoganii]PMG82538.1 glycosyltransferase [Vibrio breoganii]PMK47410.1 glycosyltransferase [Vibrio breoganii]PML09024.1 glycosyltransferase [Vibrio breoganii]
MKILYGVQGTGNGHIARARAMAEAFKNRDGIQVDFVFSGREREKYFSMESFNGYRSFSGLTFNSHCGKVDYLKTATNNNLVELFQDINSLNVKDYDLVLNDFEPISAWAAKKHKVPCIGISHQNAFRFQVPKKGFGLMDKTIIHHFAPSDFQLGLHWYHFEQPILPPIVHTCAQGAVTEEAFILVYLPFEDLKQVADLLQRFSDHSFRCYHPDVRDADDIGNVQFRPLSFSSFQRDLSRCQGVIANGGFELPSEALSLGKKLLLKPLNGQFEQQSNVATLEYLGLGSAMLELEAGTIRKWLGEQKPDPIRYPDVAGAISDWVIEGDWHQQEALSQKLWKKVDFPSHITHLLD